MSGEGIEDSKCESFGAVKHMGFKLTLRESGEVCDM
jgi:hypothetical protein